MKKAVPGAFLCLFAFVLFFPSPAQATEKAKVNAFRHWAKRGYSRVVISLSAPVDFKEIRLRNPERLVVDLKGSALQGKKTLPAGDGIIKKVRAAQYDRDTVRVVLELEKAKDYKVYALTEPFRVVIDVFSASRAETDAAKKPIRIVIDPGHGGHDPGAVGWGGLEEKDIVLDVAKEVREMLSEEGYEILLTRQSDVFLSLDERTDMANQKEADLFVSIHANASPNVIAKGMETYLLNWTDDEEAMKVAARENAISIDRMREARSELGVILASLELQNKRDESLRVAHYIQNLTVSGLRDKYKNVIDLGVKQALFYVLVGAKMPSVLVEVSFVTNRDEAKRLKSPAYREFLGRGIAEGIKSYFEKAFVQEMAGR